MTAGLARSSSGKAFLLLVRRSNKGPKTSGSGLEWVEKIETKRLSCHAKQQISGLPSANFSSF